MLSFESIQTLFSPLSGSSKGYTRSGKETRPVAKSDCLFMLVITHTAYTTQHWQDDSLAQHLMWLWILPHANDSLIVDCPVDVKFLEYVVYDWFQSDMYSSERKAKKRLCCPSAADELCIMRGHAE